MVKVFISWSGEQSKAVAEELRDWLPTIVQSLELFISTQDMPIGGRGLNVLASKLEECSFGILCLTQENKQGPWIHFEAGALSKVIDTSGVVPLLLDLKVSDLTGPLAQFQAVSIQDSDGVFSMIKALSEQSSPPIAEGRLRRLFDAFWPELEAKVIELKDATGSRPGQEIRGEREILEEILIRSRNAERQVAIASENPIEAKLDLLVSAVTRLQFTLPPREVDQANDQQEMVFKRFQNVLAVILAENGITKFTLRGDSSTPYSILHINKDQQLLSDEAKEVILRIAFAAGYDLAIKTGS
jgi:TIR domain